MFATVDKTAGAKGIAAFIVAKDTPGFVVVKANESKLGLRSTLTSELRFENCVIPLENRLVWALARMARMRNDEEQGMPLAQALEPIYVDSVVYRAENLRYRVDAIGADHVAFGTCGSLSLLLSEDGGSFYAPGCIKRSAVPQDP